MKKFVNKNNEKIVNKNNEKIYKYFFSNRSQMS